jgi:hypothetical protein
MYKSFDTWDIDSLWRDLSFGTKTVDIVTLILNLWLILNFDPVLKNINLGYIFGTRCVGALILEI